MINWDPWIGKKEIVKLVENKIRDENLKMWDTRFRFFMALGGALIVILGIIIPLWRTNTSTKETREAIQEMEDKFARLAGTQLREPDESDFGQVFARYLFFGLGSRLIPQDSQTFGIQIDKEIRAKAMLKILFGHEPRRIPFTFVVQKRE